MRMISTRMKPIMIVFTSSPNEVFVCLLKSPGKLDSEVLGQFFILPHFFYCSLDLIRRIDQVFPGTLNYIECNDIFSIQACIAFSFLGRIPYFGDIPEVTTEAPWALLRTTISCRFKALVNCPFMRSVRLVVPTSINPPVISLFSLFTAFSMSVKLTLAAVIL